MSNHPNRGSPTSASTPTPEAIRAARDAAGITQTAAAGLVHTTCRVWQQWEAGDRRMHPAFWELFKIKVSV
jgi:DNA-binding transcriptional regulator YiaG